MLRKISDVEGITQNGIRNYYGGPFMTMSGIGYDTHD